MTVLVLVLVCVLVMVLVLVELLKLCKQIHEHSENVEISGDIFLSLGRISFVSVCDQNMTEVNKYKCFTTLAVCWARVPY